MTPYQNLNGNSGVVSYEATNDSIQVEFRTGSSRHYLYNHVRPGKTMVDQMKVLAVRGYGLNSYITTTVRENYADKW